MARNRMIYLAVLVAAGMFYSFYYRWFSWYFLLLVLALPLLSLLCSLPAMLSLRVHMEAPAAVSRGERAELRFTLRAALPVAVCRTAITCRTAFGETTHSGETFLPLGTSGVALPAAHCGVLRYRVSPLRVYDYLGLFSLRIQPEKQGELLVYPVPVAPDPLPRPVTTLPVRYQKGTIGSNEAYELREYVPGDDLRTVHWKATAKKDELIVREAMTEEQAPAVLTFDPGTDADGTDWVLERVVWVSRWLLRQEKTHELQWMDGDGGVRRCSVIREEEDIRPAVELILRALPRVYSAAGRLEKASWHCHIGKKEAQK